MSSEVKLTHYKQEFYTAAYYDACLGPDPYHWNSGVWRQFYKHVAAKIAEAFNPASVLDAGCAIGFLVDELLNLSIDAYGFDFSEYAVSVAEANGLKSRVWQGDLVHVEGVVKYPLVTCIEIVEHIPEQFAFQAIANLCHLSSKNILFSSTPDDFTEATHFNVQPEDYWLDLFEHFGFKKVGTAPWLCKHAVILEKLIP